MAALVVGKATSLQEAMGLTRGQIVALYEAMQEEKAQASLETLYCMRAALAGGKPFEELHKALTRAASLSKGGQSPAKPKSSDGAASYTKLQNLFD